LYDKQTKTAYTKECRKHGILNKDQIRSYMRNRRGRHELILGCKLCHRETASKARNIDRDKANEWARLDRKNNPEKYRIYRKNRRLMHGSKIVQNEILRRFKLSLEQYEQMKADQANLCAICNKPETTKSRTKDDIKKLAIDHCHKTTKVRGLLCHHCNAAIGHFKDSIPLLESAIAYLRKHNAKDGEDEVTVSNI
jgi:hypothetical protein